MTERVSRRLVALLSADISGYARLMGADEVGTVRMLTAYRALLGGLVAEHHGRIVDAPGDNVLAEFVSVVDAVECALRVQHALRARNAALPPARRMEFRIGINLGDVIVQGAQLYGDGVNIAARVQELAEPGGISLSGPAYDQVVDKLPCQFTAGSTHLVKNIARPLRVYGVIMEEPGSSSALPDLSRAGRSVRRARPAARRPSAAEARTASAAHLPSIAVLPYREYEAAEGQRYFAEGIVDDVVGALASLPDLFVISRNSTLSFRGGAPDVRAVGRKLGVRYVVSGSIRRTGREIRITDELCDTETREVLWTDHVDGSVDGLFTLQERLSERIVTTLAPHVRQAELRRALRKRPDNLDAYDFMLRGLDLLYRLRRDEFDQALTMLERAIELDPNYASPYALSAIWHSIAVGQGWSRDPAADHDEVTRLAAAAIDRDPFDARALALCGHTRALLFHDYDGAFALFDRALSASPNSLEAWVRSSPAFSYVGDGAEAKRRAEQALRLSPFDSHLFYTHTALALAAYTSDEFEAAVAWGRKAMSQNPRYTATLRILTASLAAAGRLEEARAVGRALLELAPGFRVQQFCRTYAYREASRREALAARFISAGLPE